MMLITPELRSDFKLFSGLSAGRSLQEKRKNKAFAPEIVQGRNRCRGLRKNLAALCVISIIQESGYAQIWAIFLAFSPVFRYHNGMVIEKKHDSAAL
jgi:hypothetical protein